MRVLVSTLNAQIDRDTIQLERDREQTKVRKEGRMVVLIGVKFEIDETGTKSSKALQIKKKSSSCCN